MADYWSGAINIADEIFVYDLPFHNYQATTDPTVDDDASENYAPGSQWLNKTDGYFWICLRATVGAAIWRRATDDVDGGSA